MKSVFAILVIFLIQPSWALEINSASLKSLVESKNIQVEASKLEVEAAEERKRSLMRSFLPSIELYGAQETFKKGQQSEKSQPLYGVEANINIFNGGRDWLDSDIRDLEWQKKNFQHTRVQSEVLETVRSTYWQIIYSQEKVQLLEAAIKSNKESLKSAERRIQSGVATQSDRIEFEMKAVELDQELSETKLHLESQKRNLAVLLGIDNHKEMTFTEKLEHEHDYEVTLAHSKQDHAYLYKEAELQSEVSRKLASQQNRNWVPKLDAYASYNQFNERGEDKPAAIDRRESVVGLRVSLSLGSVFNSYSEAASLKKEALSAQKLADLQKKQVDIHVSTEMAELELLHNQVHAAEENIIRAEKYHKLAQSEYSRGVIGSPDFLSASEKLYEIRHKRIEIIKDFHIAKAHVLSKIGR
ncbi:TolC family protein [bacterium]|nr:TolC family protein [bacterium]